MAELLEAVMLICFGLSWPLNAYKNYKAGTAVGTSWQFIALITAGYTLYYRRTVGSFDAALARYRESRKE